jgi:hypothetical protein
VDAVTDVSALIIWLGPIGAANVSLPRYLKQLSVLCRLTTENCALLEGLVAQLVRAHA